MAERLRVAGLERRYGSREILRGVGFEVADGEVLALLGPSGSGKTTILNAVAGLDRPDAGEIALDGTTVCGPRVWLPPERRGIGFVFQGQMLWPHMTVAQHLGFVLRAQGVTSGERSERLAAQLLDVQLAGRDGAYPAQLSGGERQRLAIARALAARPKLLLLDEPCANLDAPLKLELLALLSRLRARQGFAALYVTHDAAEAFELATRIAILDGGRLIQHGTPRDLLERPASAAVARLLGRGALLDGTLQAPGRAATPLGDLEVEGPAGAAAGARVQVYLREDELRVEAGGPLSATVQRAYHDGAGWVAVLDANGVFVRARASEPPTEGAKVSLASKRPARAYALVSLPS
ncbi:MAG: ABC transporter ATP-binding protein [Planctomycetota bacterium]|nr:ABC transporter ATP-binding protein [Planctomycetota bacterium]